MVFRLDKTASGLLRRAGSGGVLFPPFPTSLFPDRRSRAVAIAVAVVLGVCTYYHWRAPDPIQHAKLDSCMDRIQELEREIVGDVTFMRVGDKRSTRIREHVGELGQGVLDLKRMLERDYPSVVLQSADLFASLYSMVETQERSVSGLMLHLEFVQQRLNRLPETVGALERMAPTLWQDPELTAALSSIQRDLFVSAARNVASADHWFEEDLERMRTLRDLASAELAPVIDRLVSYCQSLAERVRYVDAGLRELESLPVSRAVDELREACLLDFIARRRTARVWRWGLVFGLACTIAMLAFRILVLGKSTQLDQTESELLKAQIRSKDDFVEDLELRLEDERLRAERAEASFRRARSQELAALRVKKEFLTFLDLRVRSRARSLLAAVVNPEASEERRLAVPADAQALHDTLCDMFDMESIRAGALELERTPCTLGSILERVEAYGRALARTKAISLSVQRAEDAPETIYTDPDRLRRILQNLLEHAIVSTDTGEVELSVDPSLGNVQKLQFTVRDTGRGMNSDRIDFLFTPPQEGERIEDRAEAMATPGLSIVPSLVRGLEGAFHVDSVIGRGTTVSFEIGISEPKVRRAAVNEQLADLRPRPAAGRAETTTPPRSRPDPSRPLAGRRILVAEDGEDNRRLMQHVLARAGAEVDMAENGEMAYEDAMAAGEQGDPYDIILMDMNMPVMDGYEATENLRADGYTAPIVALTASALPENRRRCLDVGCDEFLTKPVDAKVFAHVLEGIALDSVGLARRADRPSQPDAKVEDPPAARGEVAAEAPGEEPTPELQPAASVEEAGAPDEEEAPSLVFSEYASDDDMSELIELFVKDLKSDIRRINTALSEGDLESLGVLAHQLKGSAGSYGFPQLTEQADRLESCVRAGVDPDRLEQEVRAFVDLCRRVSA